MSYLSSVDCVKLSRRPFGQTRGGRCFYKGGVATQRPHGACVHVSARPRIALCRVTLTYLLMRLRYSTSPSSSIPRTQVRCAGRCIQKRRQARHWQHYLRHCMLPKLLQGWRCGSPPPEDGCVLEVRVTRPCFVWLLAASTWRCHDSHLICATGVFRHLTQVLKSKLQGHGQHFHHSLRMKLSAW